MTQTIAENDHKRVDMNPTNKTEKKIKKSEKNKSYKMKLISHMKNVKLTSN